MRPGLGIGVAIGVGRGAVGGAAAFDIGSLSPYLWLRADMGTVAGSSGIATWEDQSGNGHDFDAVSSSTEPTLNSTVINGHPGLVGDGANTLMTSADFTGAAETGSVDVFIVMVRTTDPPTTGSGGCWQLGSPGGQEDYTPYGGDALIYCGLFSTTRKSTGVGLGTDYFETPRLFEVHSAANSWKLFTDGAEQYSTTTNTVSNGASSTPALFGDPDASGVRLNGALAEVVIFAPGLSDDNRALVRADLAARWGLSI